MAAREVSAGESAWGGLRSRRKGDTCRSSARECRDKGARLRSSEATRRSMYSEPLACAARDARQRARAACRRVAWAASPSWAFMDCGLDDASAARNGIVVALEREILQSEVRCE